MPRRGLTDFSSREPVDANDPSSVSETEMSSIGGNNVHCDESINSTEPTSAFEVEVKAEKPVVLTHLLYCIFYIVLLSSVTLANYRHSSDRRSSLLYFDLVMFDICVSLPGPLIFCALFVLPLWHPSGFVRLMTFLCMLVVVSHVFLMISSGMLIVMHHSILSLTMGTALGFVLFALFCTVVITCTALLMRNAPIEVETVRLEELGFFVHRAGGLPEPELVLLRRIVEIGDEVTWSLYSLGFVLQLIVGICGEEALVRSFLLRYFPFHVAIHVTMLWSLICERI